MSDAIRHHWVPRFYLSYFSTVPNSDKLYVTDVKAAYAGESVGKKNKKRPSDVAKLEHLYSAAGDTPEKPDISLERAFGQLEANAAKLWKRLHEKNLTSFAPGSEDRLLLSEFIAAQHLRGPRMMAVAEYAINPDNPEVITSEDAEKFYEALKAIPLTLGASTADMNKRALFREVQSEFTKPIADDIHKLHWTVRVTTKRNFVTTDNPVYIVRHGTMEPWRLDHPESILFYPLTTQHMLVATKSPQNTEDGAFIDMSEEQANKLNRFTVHYAVNEAFSPFELGDDFPYLRD